MGDGVECEDSSIEVLQNSLKNPRFISVSICLLVLLRNCAVIKKLVHFVLVPRSFCF